MMHITADKVTPAIRSLFRSDEMVASRCFVVLDGAVGHGKILVDDAVNPKWAVVQEAVDNCLFLGGKMDATTFAEVFALLIQQGDVLIGLPLDDPRLSFLPPNPYYVGRVVESYDRPIGKGLDAFLRRVPAGCKIERLNRHSIMRTEWGPDDVAFYGGIESWEKMCFGYGLMQGDEVLSEATVGPPGMGIYEPGVFTHVDHRSKGYGTQVVARLIQEIEALGGRTFWNCDKQNLASVAISRKLGYRTQREYCCIAWKKQNGIN